MGAKLQKDIDKCNYFQVFFHNILRNSKKLRIFAPAFRAQMAESVDALVSNTSGATRPGSTPGLGTSFKKQSSVGQVLTEDFLVLIPHTPIGCQYGIFLPKCQDRY